MTHQSRQDTQQKIADYEIGLSAEEFKDLYIQQPSDDDVVAFQDGVGFSIAKRYAEGTEYSKYGNLMFIRIYLKKEFVCGGIEMVIRDSDNSDRYFLVDASKYKKRVTGFLFSEEEGLIFNAESKKITYKGRVFSVNELIDILVKNHLKDKLFIKRKINYLIRSLLRFVFWLSGREYDEVKISLHSYDSGLNNQTGIESKTEPFFKYFYISKNILFTLSVLIVLILFFIQKKGLISDNLFNASNPIFVFSFFLFLFISEKMTSFFNDRISEFFGTNKKENFISWLHFYQYKNSFKLKI
jgi:hypothetical protein